MRLFNNMSRIVVICGTGALLASGCAGPIDPEAREVFLHSLGNTSIAVYPAFVRDREPPYDENAAVRIGAFLTDEQLADVTITDERVPITSPWRRNQARMLRESAAEFAEYVKANPIDTEYALMPEYLMVGSGVVGGIHCYIVDAENRLAFVVLQNSHWPIFAEVNPKTIDDCTEVLIRVLRQSLTPAQPDE